MKDVYIKTNELPVYIADEYFYGKDLISIEELISVMEDMKCDLEKIAEDYKDLVQDVEDNYKFIGTREAIGYDERTW